MDLEWNQALFDEALRQYMEVTKKTLPQVLNTKAYYIARKATWFTAKASRAAISDSLGSRSAGSRRLSLRPGTRPGNDDAPLAALIIQARRAAKGQPGLYGSDMEAAINELLSNRIKSIAYLRSGWLPAIRILAKYAKGSGAPPMGDARQFGPDQGTAEPAQADWKAISTIINTAASQSHTSRASGFAGFKKEGEEGLRRAFQDETGSMYQYIEEQLKPAADEFNAKGH